MAIALRGIQLSPSKFKVVHNGHDSCSIHMKNMGDDISTWIQSDTNGNGSVEIGLDISHD